MKRMLTYIAALSLIAVGSLAPDSLAHAQDNSSASTLVGTEWKLVEIQRSAQDVASVADANITITFDSQGRVGGNSSCNSYGGSYQAGPSNALTFGDIISTLRACVDTRLMDLETEYYRALNGVASYSISGSTLRLTYNGASVLEFTAGAPSTPGMPRTGTSGADYTLFLIIGLALAALVAGSLAWSRRSHNAT